MPDRRSALLFNGEPQSFLDEYTPSGRSDRTPNPVPSGWFPVQSDTSRGGSRPYSDPFDRGAMTKRACDFRGRPILHRYELGRVGIVC